ncbi:MAG: hypothetical protein EOM20_07530 [Spartobacteria bacterium]|nr:hypothetical protein [Spartobacteria bacterium]
MSKVSVVAAVLSLGLLVSSQANVIINPSFEDGDGTIAGLTGWNNWNAAGEINNNWSQTYDGEDMLRMWWDSGVYQDFSVNAGWDYDVSVQTRCEDWDRLQGGVMGNVSLEWRDASDQKIGDDAWSYQFDYTQGEGIWVEAAGSAEAPQDAVSGRLVISVFNDGNGAGSAWFDSATVTAIPEPVSCGLLGIGLLSVWYFRKNR